MQQLAFERWEEWKAKHGVIENSDDDETAVKENKNKEN